MAELMSAAFYALNQHGIQDEGIGRDTIAIFMLVAVLDGLAFQNFQWADFQDPLRPTDCARRA